MTGSRRFTAVIEREGDGYVSLCPELDIASQGDSIEEARANLIDLLTFSFHPEQGALHCGHPPGWSRVSLYTFERAR